MRVQQAKPRAKKLGRRAGVRGESREAILRAARVLFARRGFRGTTMRAIAQGAGVDVALVHYFFGSKSELFSHSVVLPIDAQKVASLLSAPASSPGGEMVRHYLDRLFVDRSEAIAAMLRAGLGDPGCVPALRTLIEENLVSAAAGGLRSADARLRAELVGATMVGLFISRCIVGVQPLASAPVEEIVTLLGPALDLLLGERAISERSGHPVRA
jgi:AcrR family transcriptional regulator